ncbi:MAG: methyltransferase domain-containing protein [Candidatus Limnocylindrales bacterium]|nr:methyltransferase domain-containing protein [Candidatus Limnocylindrales bacterium]
MCAGKKVIHVGCVDHLEVLDSKIQRGIWLHKRLTDVSKRCLGVDINAAGIERLRELGHDDVICADLTQEAPAAITGDDWDVMVLGEILEHVDDPTTFLRSLRGHLRGHVETIVVTVPSAFSLQNMWYALQGKECINSDHRYWFSPYTLAKIMMLAGLTPIDFHLCKSAPPDSEAGVRGRLRSIVRDSIVRVSPGLDVNLVMTARL